MAVYCAALCEQQAFADLPSGPVMSLPCHAAGRALALIVAVWVQGRVVNFKNTLIIMTSNVGSSVIEKGGGRIGFQLEMQTEEDSSYNRIKNLVNEELKQYFRCV